jgi:hypothetical protein
MSIKSIEFWKIFKIGLKTKNKVLSLHTQKNEVEICTQS